MSLRGKLTLIVALLILALGCAVLAGNATLKAVKAFQQENMMTQSGDVESIRSWMTIPYIAHTYHIPESYLYQQLKLNSNDNRLSHNTLHMLAAQHQRPVDDLIHQLQRAILSYRKQHGHSPPLHPTPPPTPPAHDRHPRQASVERITN